MNRAVVALGSNVDAEANLPRALEVLAARFCVVARSRVLRTEPVGPPGQPGFLNAAVALETALGAQALREALRGIEAELGRVRTADKYAPRPIDLDVVAWNGRVTDPDVGSRGFLRALVAEVAPEVSLPPPPSAEGSEPAEDSPSADGPAAGQDPPADA